MKKAKANLGEKRKFSKSSKSPYSHKGGKDAGKEGDKEKSGDDK
jgi:hypothetical protein